MADEGTPRAIRGALGNALTWGVSWAGMWVGAVAVYTVLGVIGIGPGLSPLNAVGAAGRFGVAFGVIGAVAGLAFSAFMRLSYRGRRLSELSAVRLGIAGGILAGLFVPAFLQAMNVLSGDGAIPMHLVLDDAPFGALFGFGAAALSLKLAQRAEPADPGGIEPEPRGKSRGGSAPGALPRSRMSGHMLPAPGSRGPRVESH